MKIKATFTSATYVFPAQWEKLKKVMEGVQTPVTLEEKGVDQIITFDFTRSLGKDPDPEMIFQMGLLAQSCLQ